MKKNSMQKIKPEIRNALKNLGFTDYNINIYITLLDSGEMNAHDLSKRTGVPYSRIYEVLNEMTNKQKLLTKLDGRPSTFVANNPKDIFKSIKQQKDEEFEENMKSSLPFLNNLYGDHNIAKQMSFTIFEGAKSCRDHVRNVLNFTVKNLSFSVKDIDEVYKAIKVNFDFLKRIGCKIQILLEERFRNSEIHNELKKNCEIRFIPTIRETLLISDEKTAFMAIKSHFNILKPSEISYSIISSSDLVYVTFITEIFNQYWQDSKI
ncbi:MAG: TrmB family transcriptional regulator [Promethearchaeota archaeon]